MTDEHVLPQPVFTDPRRVSIELHDHLRALILSDVLVGGSVLKQAELARAFGVSRTPTREAFRMLQEEGLIEAIYNQRARVRQLDLDEVDQLYAVRIVLETLGVRLTAGRLSDDEDVAARAILVEMDAALALDEVDLWISLHRRFHEICMARSDEPLTRIIGSYTDRSLRYSRVAQSTHPDHFASAHENHLALLDALKAGDATLAGAIMARHLSLTSLAVLRSIDPDATAHAVLQATTLAGGDRP